MSARAAQRGRPYFDCNLRLVPFWLEGLRAQVFDSGPGDLVGQ